MARPPDLLQGRCDREGRLHQDHLIEGADVDPQLQGIGGYDGGKPSLLHAALHHRADFPGEGAVVGIGDGRRFAIVEQAGQALGQAAIVGEDEGGARAGDEALDLLRDGGPDVAFVAGQEGAGHPDLGFDGVTYL